MSGPTQAAMMQFCLQPPRRSGARGSTMLGILKKSRRIASRPRWKCHSTINRSISARNGLARRGRREEAMATNFTVNGKAASTGAPPATPLLWVIREDLKLTGTKFGCGTGLCGACMVHIEGKRAYSCQTQVSEVAGKSVTTIEGLSPDSSHPLQKAWLAE